MIIKVKAFPSEISVRTYSFDLDFSKEEWEGMNQKDQEQILQNELDSLPDQPYWALDGFWVAEH